MTETPDDRDLEASEVASDSETTASSVSESAATTEAVTGDAAETAGGSGDDATDDDAAAEPSAEPVAVDADANDAGDEAEDDEPEAEAAPAAPAPAPAETAKRPARRGRRGAKEEPPKPAPRRGRGRRDPGAPRPVVRAQAKYVRSSARKARLVCDNIRGKTVEEARAILAVTPRAVARDWSKLLESAVANAEHNHELVGEDLYVKAVHADEGPTIKRFRPRAMGRATKIRKRTAHLTILLTPKD